MEVPALLCSIYSPGFSRAGGGVVQSGGWLIYHEGSHLGHTLARHVHVADASLIHRFVDARIRSASRFLHPPMAECVIAETIRQNRAEITRWRRNEAAIGRYLRLRWTNTNHVVIGRGLKRVETVVHNLSRDARIILAPKENGKYFILTAFPEVP